MTSGKGNTILQGWTYWEVILSWVFSPKHINIYTIIKYIENNKSEEANGELLVVHAGKLGTQGAGEEESEASLGYCLS